MGERNYIGIEALWRDRPHAFGYPNRLYACFEAAGFYSFKNALTRYPQAPGCIWDRDFTSPCHNGWLLYHNQEFKTMLLLTDRIRVAAAFAEELEESRLNPGCEKTRKPLAAEDLYRQSW